MIKSNVNCYKFSTNPNQLWVTGCDKANPYILLKARFETHVLLFICHNQTSTYYLLDNNCLCQLRELLMPLLL